MGITIGPSFTTLNGIELQELYLSLANARFVTLGDGNIKCVFMFDAHTSRDAKRNGFAPIQLSIGQNIGEIVLTTSDFINQNIYTLAYQSIKNNFNGYDISNIFESGQSPYLQYRFNAEGYDINGYNAQGYNSIGYNSNGYDAQGYDTQGYNSQGYNILGYNRQGYNSAGFNQQGFNTLGFNSQGFNSQGYDINGYNIEGYNSQGYNSQGYNSQGYDSNGYNSQGFNVNGLSMNGGYNIEGYLPDGTLAPFPSTIIVYNKIFPDNPQSFAIRSDPETIANLMTTLSEGITAYEQQQQPPL